MKPKVAFVGAHNSCRSQMAEALGRLLAADVFESYSGGTAINPVINDNAVRTVSRLYGVDMSAQRSKLVAELPPVDVVVTMGHNVSCPFLPCKMRENWSLADPTGHGDVAFATTVAALEAHVLDLRERLRTPPWEN